MKHLYFIIQICSYFYFTSTFLTFGNNYFLVLWIILGIFALVYDKLIQKNNKNTYGQ